MKSQTIVSFGSVISFGFASPLLSLRYTNETREGSEDVDPNGYPDYGEVGSYDPTNPDEICNLPITTPYDRRASWYGSEAGYQTDFRVRNEGYEGWFDSIINLVFENSPPSETGCDALGVDGCDLPLTCEEWAEKGFGDFYWLMYAVTSMQTVFSEVYELLQSNVMQNMLDVDTLTEDFGEEEEPISAWAALSAAFGWASLASGSIPGGEGLSTSMDALSSATGMIDDMTEPDDPSVAVTEQISNWFENSMTGLQKTYFNILGKTGGDQDQIPWSGRTEHDLYGSVVGQWFAEGKWLHNDVQSVLGTQDAPQPYWETAKKNSNLALATRIIGSQGAQIWITDSDNEEDCTECIGEVCPPNSATWLEDKCFEMSGPVKEGVESSTGFPYYKEDFDEGKWDKLLEYGLDAEEFYLNALECMQNNPDGGDIDGAEIAFNGEMPACFYNIPVVAGEWSPYTGEFEGDLP